MADPFTCPFCSAVSHNPRDAEERYCVRCHLFVDDAMDAMLEAYWFPDPPKGKADD